MIIKKLIMCLSFLLSLIAVNAQEIVVKGNVTSKSDGFGIIGATVISDDNPKNGTATDIDGNFTLTVLPNSNITISYIGYKSAR